MIATSDLRQIARARLRDSVALFQKKRYDGAVYICGYAVEIALKARICRTLKWPGFPSTSNEFQNYQSFRSHNLDVLLHLSGVEATIKPAYLADWSIVLTWQPEARYRAVGTATHADALLIIQATRVLLKVLL